MDQRFTELDITCTECASEARYKIFIEGDEELRCATCGSQIDPEAVGRIRKALKAREDVLPNFRRNIRALGKGLRRGR